MNETASPTPPKLSAGIVPWVASFLRPGGRSPLVRWVFAGGLFMGINTAILYGLVDLLTLPVALATFIAAEIGTVFRFLVNDAWVFGHQRPTWARLWQYHLANASAFAIWWAAANGLTLAGTHYLLASVLAVGFSTGFSMASNFFWIWKKKSLDPIEPNPATKSAE